jgi:hypothetical protein
MTMNVTSISPRASSLEILKWVFLAAGFLLLLNQYLDRDYSNLWLSAFLISMGLIQLARQYIPVSIILLGFSTRETITFQAEISRIIAPFRIVSLLETGDFSIDGRIAGESLRVKESEPWIAAVFAFVSTVPIVVVYISADHDSTHNIASVREEVTLILQSGNTFRTIFVEENPDYAFFREIVNLDKGLPENILFMQSREEACNLISYIFNIRGAIPNEELTVWKLYAEYTSLSTGGSISGT